MLLCAAALTVLLVIAGVEQNPGPGVEAENSLQVLCSGHDRNLKSGTQCDMCGHWFHNSCVNVKAGRPHRAGVAWCRGDLVRKGWTGNNVARGPSREWTHGKRRRVDPEGSTGIKDPGTRRQLHLRNEKIAGQIFGKTFRLENAKRIARSTVGLRTNKDWTLWRGRPPPKRKKKRKVEQEPVM
jgi:hypothetical protein